MIRALICGLLILWVLAVEALMLAWDPSERATGYKVYYGTASQVYDTILDVGAVTSVVISDLVPGQVYYFAATAYNAAGESGFSNEVWAMIPGEVDTTPPTVVITSPLDGAVVLRKELLTIEASATDDGRVVHVRLSVQGEQLCVDGTEPYRCTWQVPAPPARTYELQAEAVDAAGNQSPPAIVTVISSEAGPPC